jgi:hypothetical protein
LSYRPATPGYMGWWRDMTTLCRSWLYPPVMGLWIRLG